MDAAELSDIEAIRQLKARYFRLMDAKRWDEWRDCFTDDLRMSAPTDTGSDEPTEGRDVFVETTSAFLAEVVSVHHGHMSEIRVEGDEATGVWSMEDNLWWPPGGGIGHLWGTGWYEERYRRCDDGRWRIAALHLKRIRLEIDGRVTHPAG